MFSLKALKVASRRCWARFQFRARIPTFSPTEKNIYRACSTSVDFADESKKKLLLIDFMPIVYKSFYASAHMEFSLPFSKVFGHSTGSKTTFGTFSKQVEFLLVYWMNLEMTFNVVKYFGRIIVAVSLLCPKYQLIAPQELKRQSMNYCIFFISFFPT